ncbi:hypothetical protein HDU86_000936 [Geranomyces michiganensis]|nr:hypothetical protein HDU86_000936 [Geranomyces michiganensis]
MTILSDDYSTPLAGKLSGHESSDDIAHDLVASAACVTHLESEIRELKQQVADLTARLQGQQHETEVGAEKATKVAIAERFDISLQTLSDTEYKDKLEFMTRVIAMSSLGVRPEADCAQVRFDVALETLMDDPAHFCRELEKFDSFRRVDNDQWSWLELYNDLHGKHGGLAYFLKGDPDVRMTTEIS